MTHEKNSPFLFLNIYESFFMIHKNSFICLLLEILADFLKLFTLKNFIVSN